MNYVRLILSLDDHFGWEAHQMEDKSAFPHGDLTEDIYREQPPNFEKDGIVVC
jgi:hypothetical protein